MKNNKLPHDHGQNEEKILENLPTVEECKMVAEQIHEICEELFQITCPLE